MILAYLLPILLQMCSFEEQTILVEKRSLDSEEQTILVEKRSLDSEEQTILVEKRSLDSEEQTILVEKRSHDSEEQTIPVEKRSLDSEVQTIPVEKRSLDSEAHIVLVQKRGGNLKAKECDMSYVKIYHDSCLEKGYHKTKLGKACKSLVTGKGYAKKRCKKIEMQLIKCRYSCDIDGGWSEYRPWSECSAECGGGESTRTRTCDNPAPVGGGADCKGEAEETESCNTHECAVDGEFRNWTDWTECSEKRGPGLHGGAQPKRNQKNNQKKPSHSSDFGVATGFYCFFLGFFRFFVVSFCYFGFFGMIFLP